MPTLKNNYFKLWTDPFRLLIKNDHKIIEYLFKILIKCYLFYIKIIIRDYKYIFFFNIYYYLLIITSKL